jgi:diguanylate cyclase (GGDEF)-like protein
MTGFRREEKFSLRRFRIGTRLILGFGSILLILIAMAGINRVLNDQSKKTLIGGLKVAEKKENLAVRMKGSLLEGAIALRNIGLVSDWESIRKAHEVVQVERRDFLAAKQEFIAAGLTAEEGGILTALTTVDEQLQEPLRDAMLQALAYNQEDAAKILSRRAGPLSQAAIREINKLVAVQQAAVDDVFVKYDADDAKMKFLLLLCCCIALGLGGLMAWVITLSIIYPLMEAVSIAKEVASGGLSPMVSIAGNDEVSQLMRALKEMVTCLSSAQDRLRDLSRFDGLTGVRNRAYFDERFEIEWRRAQRGRYMIGVLMIDIDHFKAINDNHGHLGGDVCLKRVAEAMRMTLHRGGDELFRYGGEEFVMLLANADLNGATHISELVRQQVEALDVFFEGRKIPMTVSVGVAVIVPGDEDSAYLLVGNADKALYQAKLSGRNQVCLFKEHEDGRT